MYIDDENLLTYVCTATEEVLSIVQLFKNNIGKYIFKFMYIPLKLKRLSNTISKTQIEKLNLFVLIPIHREGHSKLECRLCMSFVDATT